MEVYEGLNVCTLEGFEKTTGISPIRVRDRAK